MMGLLRWWRRRHGWAWGIVSPKEQAELKAQAKRTAESWFK